jgi:hypothetical protein
LCLKNEFRKKKFEGNFFQKKGQKYILRVRNMAKFNPILAQDHYSVKSHEILDTISKGNNKPSQSCGKYWYALCVSMLSKTASITGKVKELF